MTLSANSSVAVILPVYNGSRFLTDAITSLAVQKLRPNTIVVADDASTDDSVAVATAALSQLSTPVQIIRMPANSGSPAAPINAAISAISDSVIAVLDQDDAYCPGHLGLCADAIATFPDVGFVCCRAEPFCSRTIWNTEDWLSWAVFRRLGYLGQRVGKVSMLDGTLVLATLLVTGNFVVGYPGFVFRRDLWERKGGVDATLRIASDYDLLCWLSTQGPVALLAEPLFRKRIHDCNLSLRGLGSLREGLTVAKRYHHMATGPWKRNHRAISFLRSLYIRRITGLAWAGATGLAWKRLWRAVRWGWSIELGLTAGKLSAITALQRLGRIPASATAEQITLWTDVLDLAESVCTPSDVVP